MVSVQLDNVLVKYNYIYSSPFPDVVAAFHTEQADPPLPESSDDVITSDVTTWSTVSANHTVASPLQLTNQSISGVTRWTNESVPGVT